MDEIVDAVLFVLIGLELLIISFSGLTLLAGLLAFPIVILARFIAVALPVSLLAITYVVVVFSIIVQGLTPRSGDAARARGRGPLSLASSELTLALHPSRLAPAAPGSAFHARCDREES